MIGKEKVEVAFSKEGMAESGPVILCERVILRWGHGALIACTLLWHKQEQARTFVHIFSSAWCPVSSKTDRVGSLLSHDPIERA